MPDQHNDRAAGAGNAQWRIDRPMRPAQWGGKLLSECGDDEAKLVREAYADAYGRPPKDDEVKTAERFIDRQAAEIESRSDAAGRQSAARYRCP